MTRTNNANCILFPALIAFLLAGCSSGGGGTESSQPEPLNIDYSGLRSATLETGPLARSREDTSFSTYLKNGLRLRLDERNSPAEFNRELAVTDEAGAGYSATNVHVAGVDEADRLKYDGHYLYIATPPGRFFIAADENEEPVFENNSIRIMQTDPEQASVMEVSRIKVADSSTSLSQLYLVHDGQAPASALAAISHTTYLTWTNSLVEPGWIWGGGKTRIDLFNLGNIYDPELAWTLEIEGNFEGSRKIGNVLYLLTRFVPNLEELDYDAQTTEEKEANERLIRDAAEEELLPHYQVNDERVSPLVRAQDCFVPEQFDANEGYADIMVITAIDLESRLVESAACLNVNIVGFYSSPESLYLGGSHGDDWTEGARMTAVHKFRLQDGQISYRGSGAVAGSIGWQDPAFRMDELNGDLRIITTERNFSGEMVHRLSVLREQQGTNRLDLVAQLPNDSQPEPIGKPGEDIYAVRFVGELAFVVTFRRVDPLYVLDLSNPETPSIRGQIEIPGFATYLHPIDDGYLLTVGQEVDERTQPTGIKLELYDIRDIGSPDRVTSIVIGQRGSWSEAIYDLRSMAFLRSDEDQLRFALPITVHDTLRDDTDNGDGSFYDWTYSGLHLFEINGLASDGAVLQAVDKIVTERRSEDQRYPTIAGEGRSVIDDNSVYYVPDTRVWSSFWDEPAQATGPH